MTSSVIARIFGLPRRETLTFTVTQKHINDLNLTYIYSQRIYYIHNRALKALNMIFIYTDNIKTTYQLENDEFQA